VGLITAFGTLILLVVFAALSGAYAILFGDMSGFVTGDVAAYAAHTAPPLLMLAVIAAAVSIELPLGIGSISLVNLIIGKSRGEHGLSWLYKQIPQSHLFLYFFGLVFAEELFARWLFLGLMRMIPGLEGPIAFFILFLLGNGIWALVHLYNFEESGDRNPLRVLPQFIGGIAFTYIFMKYGLTASVIAHFASNAVLFALIKKQNFDGADIARIVVLALTAIISYALMDRGIVEIAPWFQRTPEFALAGWGFWDYVLADIFLGSVFALVADVLLYDKSNIHERGDDSSDGLGLSGLAIAFAIVAILTVALYYAGFWLLGLVVSDLLFRVLLLSIVMAMLFSSQNSPSAVAGRFWLCLTSGFVTVCILQALDFWPAVACVMFTLVVYIPLMIIKRFDD